MQVEPDSFPVFGQLRLFARVPAVEDSDLWRHRVPVLTLWAPSINCTRCLVNNIESADRSDRSSVQSGVELYRNLEQSERDRHLCRRSDLRPTGGAKRSTRRQVV